MNYSPAKNRPNLYFRAGRNFSERVNAGLSLARGSGISYGSLHNKAVGLDTSSQAGDFKLYTEFLMMQRRSSDRFTFLAAKLFYEKHPRLKPFIAYYNWKDKSDAFGDFRSVAYGANFEIRPELLLEAGGAKTADKTIYWLQLHLLLERNLFQRAAPAIPLVPGVLRPDLPNPSN